ncbi:DUF3667 domain-containing protein [Phenylobacterium sp.]|uniref:DUF3667 domain-containing protein n=1 Tax=Phenylobacterium sp. TaxID=1871053 RepID=UPI0035673111
MSGELEAAAADSLGHLIGRRRKAPPPGTPCANCGAELQGPYCHVCGQTADTHKRSILRLIWEAGEALFELDGRLWRTVPDLFLRPGRLARDYMDGRIVRHVPPFRTFLVALVLFIFAAEHAAHEETLSNARRKATEIAALKTPAGRSVAAGKIRDEAGTDLAADMTEARKDRAEALLDPDEKPGHAAAAYDRTIAKAEARYRRRIAEADRAAQGLAPDNAEAAVGEARTGWKAGLRKATANPDYYWSVLFSWGQRTAILLLPIVGLTLALVYRNRKQVFIYDHLLVAMNLLSFAFLTNAVGLILPGQLAIVWFLALAVWTPINLFQTLRGAYGSSVLGAILKTLIVWTTTVVSFGLLLLGLMVFSLNQL